MIDTRYVGIQNTYTPIKRSTGKWFVWIKAKSMELPASVITYEHLMLPHGIGLLIKAMGIRENED